MSGSDYDVRRRQLLRSAGAGIAGAACLSTDVGAQSGDGAPSEDDYEQLLSEMDGDGSQSSPYRITTVEQLQAVSADADGRYVLANDIDASATADWNGGSGFDPIKSLDGEKQAFTGTIQGNNREIRGLTIDRPDNFSAGLVAANSGEVGFIALRETTVNVGSGGVIAGTNGGLLGSVLVEGRVDGKQNTGGVTGNNSDSIARCEVNADITGGPNTGGIVGNNTELVTQSTVGGDVEGTARTGGLVGANAGEVKNSESQGSVTGSSVVGGCAGDQSGILKNSTMTGDVSGETAVGGVAGEHWDEMAGVTAHGTVEGTEHVGGIVGESHGKLTTSASLGSVSGTTNVGGIVGWSGGGSLTSGVYTTAQVSGDDTVGNLIGLLGWEFLGGDETVELTEAYWSTDGTDHGPVGRVDSGDGEIVANEETLVGLAGDRFVGEDASDYLSTFDFENEWLAREGEAPIPRGQATPVFEVTDVDPAEIQIQRGERLEITAQIENTTTINGSQRVEFLFNGERIGVNRPELSAGESTLLTFEGRPTEGLEAGTHTFSVRTSDDSAEVTVELTDDSGSSESTPTDTPTQTESDTPATGDDTSSDDGGPGFGIATAVTGLGTGCYLLARRLKTSQQAEP